MSTVAAQATLKVVAEAMPRAAAGATLKAAVLVRALNSEGKREPRWKQCGFFCSQKKSNKPKPWTRKNETSNFLISNPPKMPRAAEDSAPWAAAAQAMPPVVARATHQAVAERIH